MTRERRTRDDRSTRCVDEVNQLVDLQPLCGITTRQTERALHVGIYVSMDGDVVGDSIYVHFINRWQPLDDDGRSFEFGGKFELF